MVVEGEVVDGELLWEEGRLYDAAAIHPRRASRRRALDHLLGLRRGEVYLEGVRVPRPPPSPETSWTWPSPPAGLGCGSGPPGSPPDWGVAVFPQGRAGPLRPFLQKAKGKILAEALTAGFPATWPRSCPPWRGRGRWPFAP